MRPDNDDAPVDSPGRDLSPAENRRLAALLDTWEVAPAGRNLAFAINAAAARRRTPGFGWTWPRLAALAAAACLGLMVGWWDVPGETYASLLEPTADTVFFPSDGAIVLDDGEVL